MNLISLDLQGNDLVDLSGIETLSSLSSLNLSGNAISDLTPLSSLGSLSWLTLSYNEIEDISPLASLTNLSLLVLSGNNVEDISALASLTSLQTLDVSFCHVEDISALTGSTSLENFYAVYNRIKDLSPMNTWTNVQSINLYRNRVENLVPLQTNPGVGAGDYLDILSNPLNSGSACFVISAIEALGVAVIYDQNCLLGAADSCGEAVAISLGEYRYFDTSSNTGTDVSSCGTGDSADVWMAFSADAAATYEFSAIGSAIAPVISVFENCGGTEVGCAEDTLTLALDAHKTYFVRLAGGSGGTGFARLTVCRDHPVGKQSGL